MHAIRAAAAALRPALGLPRSPRSTRPFADSVQRAQYAVRRMEFFLVQLLNSLSYGLLLFMLSSGLTLIFSMMGVLNFAHASFYMLGAYFAFQIEPLHRLLAGAG